MDESGKTGEVLLSVEKLGVRFRNGESLIHAVRNVNFEIQKGKTLGLVGESGCGKSVTTKTLLQLHDPKTTLVEGKVLLGDQNIVGMNSREISTIRGNRISMIFQDPMTSLNPLIRVGDQVAEVMIRHRKLSRRVAGDKVLKLFEKVGISSPETRYRQYPHEFSGGMQQRIMIAIALACEPELLLADEPTTALDVTIQAEILKLMKRIQQKTGMSILMITHDLGVVANICDSVAVMYAGEIVEYADVFTIFEQPLHPYTQGLLAAMPTPGGAHRRLETIEGQPPRLTGETPVGCPFAPRCKKVTDRCRSESPQTSDQGGGHKVCCHLYQ